MKIYVPSFTENSCVYILNSETIRVYDLVPNIPLSVNYTDYFVNSNYLYKEGIETFTTESVLPTCINQNNLTDSYYYRNDFDSILIIFLIMCIFCFLIPIKIFIRLFRRFQ